MITKTKAEAIRLATLASEAIEERDHGEAEELLETAELIAKEIDPNSTDAELGFVQSVREALDADDGYDDPNFDDGFRSVPE